MATDRDYLTRQQREQSGCFSVISGWLIVIAEIIIVVCCMAVMYAGLKTNGQVFTETLEATRRKTWEDGSVLAIAAGIGAAAYFLFRLLRARSDAGYVALFAQLVLLLLIIGLVMWFHGAVPLPAHIHGRGIPSY
jgi:hypothetical protein